MAEPGGKSGNPATASARKAGPYTRTGGQASEPLVAQPVSKLGASARAARSCGKLGILHLLVGTLVGLLLVGFAQPISEEEGGAPEERRHAEAETDDREIAHAAFCSGTTTATSPPPATASPTP